MKFKIFEGLDIRVNKKGKIKISCDERLAPEEIEEFIEFAEAWEMNQEGKKFYKVYKTDYQRKLEDLKKEHSLMTDDLVEKIQEIFSLKKQIHKLSGINETNSIYIERCENRIHELETALMKINAITADEL
jgi:cyclophilin family peptidyl-prolyl cis-trans isomerase